jgi:uncharacterized protein (DUF885 family)
MSRSQRTPEVLARAVLLTCLMMLAACGRAPAPSTQSAAPAAPAKPSNWMEFVDQYVEAYFLANPSWAAGQGRHEFDGQLPDWSAAGITKQIERLTAQRADAVAYEDSELSLEQRFQRDYLVQQIDRDLFWLRDAQFPFTNPAYYFQNGLDPNTYVNVPYAPVDQRARAFIKYAQGIPGAIEQIRANLRTPLPKTFIEYGVRGFKGFADFYRKDVPAAFAEAKDPQLQKDLSAAIEPAAKAMEETAKWLESLRPQATDAYALGPQRFASMLAMTEAVTTPLDRLEEIGRADLERNLMTLRETCARYTPGAGVSACIAKMNRDKPSGGAVEGARNQLAQLRQFLVDHKVVSIPGTEEARVNEAPAYRRQNFAFINIPGPYEKDLPSVYYIAPPDPSWPKAEQDAYLPGKADLLFTSVHEVWPGHFLQFLHSNRSTWRFGQLFVGYAFAEGWAHYTEEMMVEEGLAKDAPQLQVGQILNALLRNVRYLCAIGLHTKGMTVAQCERMFKEQAYQDPGNARQQAARGTYDPAYLNYTMGKLLIRKLRADWEAENPGRTRKQFHDEFLSFGGPPIPLLRKQMLRAPPVEVF